ncbi:hypothetical protein J6590_042269 [Homalodisca vitripennis]|nr:hypothetical protein J6590_042269 [Homalodisca vitripennis]
MHLIESQNALILTCLKNKNFNPTDHPTDLYCLVPEENTTAVTEDYDTTEGTTLDYEYAFSIRLKMTDEISVTDCIDGTGSIDLKINNLPEAFGFAMFVTNQMPIYTHYDLPHLDNSCSVQKRKFTGNRYTASTSDKANVPNVSTSSKKLNLSRPSTSPKPNLDSPVEFSKDPTGNRIINLQLLSLGLKNSVACKVCGGDVFLTETIYVG